MENKIALTFKYIFKDLDIQQKEIALILGIKQSSVSKKINLLSMDVNDIIKISNKTGKNIFAELSQLLNEPLRNKITHKETKSSVEVAILNLVRQNLKQ